MRMQWWVACWWHNGYKLGPLRCWAVCGRWRWRWRWGVTVVPVHGCQSQVSIWWSSLLDSHVGWGQRLCLVSSIFVRALFPGGSLRHTWKQFIRIPSERKNMRKKKAWGVKILEMVGGLAFRGTRIQNLYTFRAAGHCSSCSFFTGKIKKKEAGGNPTVTFCFTSSPSLFELRHHCS